MKIELETSPKETGAVVAAVVVALAILAWAHRGARPASVQYLYAKAPPTAPGAPPGGAPRGPPPAGGKPGGWESW